MENLVDIYCQSALCSAHALWTRLLHTSGGAGPPLEDGLVPAAERACAESKAVVATCNVGRKDGRTAFVCPLQAGEREGLTQLGERRIVL